MTPRLVVMLKEPKPGRVKTRLGRDIGMTEAAWWFRHQVRALLRRIEDPRWQVMIAVSPDRGGMASRVWPAHLPRLPQGRGTLGDRMGRVLRQPGAGPVCIIGADIPGIRPRHIARAFRALGSHDAVFGPAPDGGYWLIGLSRRRAVPPGLFKGVRWSSGHALADTRATLPGFNIALIDELTDVDSGRDLAMTLCSTRVTPAP